MKGVQRELDVKVTSDLVQFEAQLQRDYNAILKQEELLWYQKVRWCNVKMGDRNTAYFHMHTVIRRKKNHTDMLKIGDDTWCEDEATLKQEVQIFFC